MASLRRLFDAILRGESDANLRFADLQRILRAIGFDYRVKGDHFIYWREGIEDIINIQPGNGGKAKPYQVKQSAEFDAKICIENQGELMRYEVIIYWSESDKAFIAEVPELAGCMADGATKAQALRRIERIAKEWVVIAKSLNRPIPKPRGRLAYA